MAIKKSELYSSLWASCDNLRGGMDASQYKDYVLTMLFIKYVSDKFASAGEYSLVEIPEGATFEDMVNLKGQTDIGDRINKEIVRPIFQANGLEGVMEPVDFNDEDKLGSGKEKVDRLSKLIAIFENPALDFTKNRAEDDDILGDAYEFLMRHFATESGKSKGQFYTPAEVSRVMAKIIDVDKAEVPSYTVYDPTCGSGSLLLKVAEEAPNGLTIYGQEKDISTKSLAIMNMWLHGNPEATIAGKNTLADPQFKTHDGQLQRFDFVVANPPFSLKNWSNGIVPMEDEFNRFIGYGEPPSKNGDYAFLLHIIASLKSTGKAAVILPHGVLFRGNAEASIRENILKRKLIKGIIGLPANLFYGTGIPACIIVIDKEGADDREGIFMIDASKGYKKDGNKNRLREQDIHKIVDVFNTQWELDQYARLVPFEEIEKNEYNLNIPRYIDTQEAEDIQDLNAHLNGGIPQRDIDELQEYWKVYPKLKTTLFSSLREGYYQLNVDKSEVKDVIFDHEEFKGYSHQLNQYFEAWKEQVTPVLNDIDQDTRPKQFIHTIAEAILEQYSNRPLIIRYDIYQHLLDYWNETMKDDVYMLIEEGWTAKVDRIIKNGKDKGWVCELIPKELVIHRYLSGEHDALQELEQKLEATESKMSELEEEYGGEDECMNEVSGKRDAEDQLEQYLLLAAQEFLPELAQKVDLRQKKLEEDLSELSRLEQKEEVENLKNKHGNITQKAAKNRIEAVGEDSDEGKRIQQWLDLTKGVSSHKRNITKQLKAIHEKIEAIQKQHSDHELMQSIQALSDYLALYDQKSDLKKDIKEAEEQLDQSTLLEFQNLTEEGVRTLVIEDKWLASIQSDIQSEIDSISQRMTSRIKELAERYEHTVGDIDLVLSEVEAKVAAHLQKMGYTV